MSYNESLNNNSNYPLMSQSEWDNAPWNQRDPEPVEVEVQVTIVLTKNIKLPVTDYIVEQLKRIKIININLIDIEIPDDCCETMIDKLKNCEYEEVVFFILLRKRQILKGEED